MNQLNRLAFRPLPLRSIRPSGWLKQQLQIQRDGLSGNLHKFWPDIQDSAWFGGDADGWERAPYWLDGVIPLSHLLDDEQLKQEIGAYMDYILTHQAEDGWLGPRRANKGDAEDIGKYDMWAVLLALKVLSVYHDAAGDDRALDVMERMLTMLSRHVAQYPLQDWAHHRWFEGLIGIFYLYEQRGDSSVLQVAQVLIDQGFDWVNLIRGKDIEEATPHGEWRHWRHVVNLTMAVKAYGLVSRLSGKPEDLIFCNEMMDRLDDLHGQATGVFSGDECVSGKSPTQGTELCAVAEYMYSLEIMSSILDDTSLADRLEKMAFNALPAAFSPDMWAHQYDQQANQVLCSINPEHQFPTNDSDSNIMGLEPNFGCCTANLSQAWPKFAAHLWMRTSKDGFAAIAYAPCIVTDEKDGCAVRIEVDTEYPFRDAITIRVSTEEKVKFDLSLRIPGWCSEARLEADWGDVACELNPGGRAVIEREWSGESVLRLCLPMPVEIENRYNNAATLTRGPLVYALRIGEEWIRVNEDKPCRELPHADYEVHPTTPWNYALHLGSDIEFKEHAVGIRPFSPDGAPVTAAIQARLVPEWGLHRGWAAPVPDSPVKPNQPIELVTLIPYGCTNLRITEFPVIES